MEQSKTISSASNSRANIRCHKGDTGQYPIRGLHFQELRHHILRRPSRNLIVLLREHKVDFRGSCRDNRDCNARIRMEDSTARISVTKGSLNA